jgi:hypothetical protein
MNILELIGLRWYLFKTSPRLRWSLAALAVVVGAGFVADRTGYLPDPVPFVIGMLLLVGALVAILALSWTKPPSDKSGIIGAIAARNSSAGMVLFLTAGLIMFTLGNEGVAAGALLPGLVLITEFAVLAFLGHRAAWYGRHPEARKQLLADRKRAAAERRAHALARIAERKEDLRLRRESVVLVEADPEPVTAELARLDVDGQPVDEPDPVVAADEPQPEPERDQLDLIDLTGGDDEDWPDEDEGEQDEPQIEIIDKQGNRV